VWPRPRHWHGGTRKAGLQRVGHGLYAAIPLDARATEQVLEDPWVLVPSLFGEAYIGGWTAAEHWDLTEQLFRDTLVFTTKKNPHAQARSEWHHVCAAAHPEQGIIRNANHLAWAGESSDIRCP
jgi:predicted transcriptional regulator of viral defense system